MPKGIDDRDGLESSSLLFHTENRDSGEAGDARTELAGTSIQDIRDFAVSFGLNDRIDVLQRGALLLKEDVDPERIPGITYTELKALRNETTHKWQQARLLWLTILVCSLGAIEQGWAQTGMNGANLYLPTALRLNPNVGMHGRFLLGFINSAMYLSNAFFGCWLSEPINNLFGRRGAILVGTVLCAVGNLGSATISSARSSVRKMVYFRLILGTGLGLNASTVSVYAAESAPAYIRGGLAVCWQMFVAFGILLGFVANVAFYNFEHDLIWRLQLAAPILPTVPILVLLYYCPESPFWYAKRSQYYRAWSSLRLLRNTEIQAAADLLSIRMGREATAPSHWGFFSYIKKLVSLFTVPRNQHALLASYAVMLSQQLCGINVIAFYSSTIFSSPGGSKLSALWASVIFGLVNFFGAFPAVWTMDTFGRRRLLLWTLPAMSLTLLFASMTFSIPGGTNNVQFAALAGTIYLFCALYSPGMGPVPCAYSAEVHAIDLREIGMSVAISTANLWAAMLSLSLPTLLEALGESGVFVLYAALNLVAWTLCWLFVRETKGVKLEDMDAVFERSCIAFVKENWHQVSDQLTGAGNSLRGYGKLQQRDSEEI